MFTNRCSKARRKISAWHDLAQPERQRLREHARACAGCRAELDAALEVLGRLENGREAYSALRYAGPRPSLRGSRALTPAEGRGFRRPLPVALAGGLLAVSLAGYLLIVSQPATIPTAPTPTPRLLESPAAEPGDASSTEETLANEALVAPQTRPPSPALETIRQQAGRMRMPAAPQRPSGISLRLPSGISLRLPSRPEPPEPAVPKPGASQVRN